MLWAMDTNRLPTPRFRVRIKAFLVLVAFIALVVVVVMQQIQIERMRGIIDSQEEQLDGVISASAKVHAQLRAILGPKPQIAKPGR
jgi:hypothetical protein